jgi:ATP-binding cassette, subfamily F, member 3
MREALAEALQDFDATLVVVAHDRHLLKATTDQLWLVADGKLGEFDGDLDDYKEWARAWHAGSRKPAPEANGEITPDRRAQKRDAAEARQRSYAARRPFELKLAELERQLDALNLEKAGLDNWLAGADAYVEANKERLQEALKRQGEVKQTIESIEWEWFAVQEKLEQASAAA